MKTLLTTILVCLFAFGIQAQTIGAQARQQANQRQQATPNDQPPKSDKICTSVDYYKFPNSSWGLDSTLVTVAVVRTMQTADPSHGAYIVLTDEQGYWLDDPKYVRLPLNIVTQVRNVPYILAVRNRVFAIANHPTKGQYLGLTYPTKEY